MNQRAKVVVTDFITEPLDHERRILGDAAEVVALNAFSEDDLVGKIEDADAIMLYHFITISARTIERLDKCKLVVRCGVGFDNVDRDAARARGINVANVPDYGTEDVASLLEAARFMDTNECSTVIAAARGAAGLSTEEALRKLDDAGAAFAKAARDKFHRTGEW